MNRVARAQLAEGVEIGADDLSDSWVAADRLAVDAKDDALAILGDLNRAGTDGLGKQFARGQRQWLALQAQAHAIAGGRDFEGLPVEFGVFKPSSMKYYVLFLIGQRDPDRRGFS